MNLLQNGWLIMTNPAFSRTDVLDILHSCVAEVTFDKVNGEQRTMICTLKEDIVPQYEKSTPKVSKKINNNIVAAFDLNKKEWRSFRLDSIKTMVYPMKWR